MTEEDRRLLVREVNLARVALSAAGRAKRFALAEGVYSEAYLRKLARDELEATDRVGQAEAALATARQATTNLS